MANQTKKLGLSERRQAGRRANRKVREAYWLDSDSSNSDDETENHEVTIESDEVAEPHEPPNNCHNIIEDSPDVIGLDEASGELPQNEVVQQSADSDEPSIHSEHSSSDNNDHFSGNEAVGMQAEDIPDYLLAKLQTWAISCVSQTKVDDLLKILSPVFPYLPVSARGLLHTPRHTEIDFVEGGEIWYKRIIRNLKSQMTEEYLTQYGRTVLDIGIDGIPLTESDCNDFWPIMGRLAGKCNQPFIIAVFCGPGKPQSLDDYFNKYCTEVLELREHGVEFHGQVYPFEIRNYILDAVARSQVKCIHAHNSEKEREKCSVTGVYHSHRETFIDLDCPLRTDESFLARDDPAHHSGTSLESGLHTNMISHFPLDGMHLIHLGIVKRFLKQILTRGPWKLHWRHINVLSDALQYTG